MTNFFALLATCLQAIADEMDLAIADIHEIESYPDATKEGWHWHVNGECFAHIKPFRGRPDVGFSAWYSEFNYLFNPQEASVGLEGVTR